MPEMQDVHWGLLHPGCQERGGEEEEWIGRGGKGRVGESGEGGERGNGRRRGEGMVRKS